MLAQNAIVLCARPRGGGGGCHEKERRGALASPSLSAPYYDSLLSGRHTFESFVSFLEPGGSLHSGHLSFNLGIDLTADTHASRVLRLRLLNGPVARQASTQIEGGQGRNN